MLDTPIPNLAHTSDFLEFNFSEIADPDLAAKVSTKSLYVLAYQARSGSRTASIEFCDAFRWTIALSTFEAFQRSCGPRPFNYEIWAYAKVEQFLAILTYEELRWNAIAEVDEEARKNPLVRRSSEDGNVILGASGAVTDAEELRILFPWPQILEFDWTDTFGAVLSSGSDWGGVLRAILDGKSAKKQTEQRRGWNGNRERDRIIVALIERGVDQVTICSELDKLVIPVLPKLETRGVHRWLDGYGNPDCQNAIQQLFSKVRKRGKAVKR